ncbi:plasma membrane iron permease [Beauveria brongniartii RCEF 3172]|uniref:Plasma membrane iron permease n=1 Tax=Beauveria brongniartii RCEF 3172 TaxID=1081107 RepID=A0A167DTT3_9HYPO|nr:plasma membrane iron permease [Beauveria brongniartii RCEF 3172]
MAWTFISAPVFLVIFRETLETAIIVSVLLAFLKQTLGRPDQDAKIYKSLCRQVWLGTAVGFLICIFIAGTIISIFYLYGRDAWAAHEYYYEGAFSLFAALVISVMGVALLRVGQMQDKWRNKLAKALLQQPVKADTRQGWLKRLAEKYALFFLPFITILREGIEAIGRDWNRIVGGDAAELGDGPGSYDIDRSVWHVNCCSPEVDGGGIWAVLNAVVGWTNSATYGSVIAYNVYWVCVMVGLATVRYHERNGRFPFMRAKKAVSRSKGNAQTEASPLLDGGAH